ncbi:T9SS type B sorting domain-containing protein [Dyadobacter psychrotolerans]|uniref:T9SS type B sorting domain-containing protein n=1 Tax=Dyadobacter psychrotolerans TaxID=2541721 RepID=A0A4R5DR89_9BACT|nr:gliding motility-associated C-terminal domain-containing protein [Dyadobacter psychrotolerans]TDE14571.1 T9SS type B sorting domain-containing protein [Dyadobacter psychrotolerans]
MKPGILQFLLASWLSVCFANGQPEKNSYRLHEDFKISAPECGPNLSAAKALGTCSASTNAGDFVEDVLPCGAQRKVYHTNRNWGLSYPNITGTISENYTIQLYLKVTDWGTTWARIIDFSNGQSDDGIYFKNRNASADRCIDFYPQGIAGPCPFFNNSTYYLLTFTRNGRTGIMDVYVNNSLFVSYNDSGKRYTGKAGTPIYIFRDDAAVSCESGEANFAYLSFSNAFTSPKDVENDFNNICYNANINSSAEFLIDPNPSCGYPKNITIDYTGSLPASSTGYSFEWDWNGGTVVSGTGRGPYVVNWNTPGEKNVTLTITNTVCGNKINNTKKAVISSLDLTASVKDATCTDSLATITLTAVEGAAPFQYSIDSVNYQSNAQFRVKPASYRIYIKDANNCSSVKEVKIAPVESIFVQTIGDTTICKGQQIPLPTKSNAVSFSWLPVNGLDNAALQNPTASPESTAQFIVEAKKDDCVTTDTVTIFVVPDIEVNVTPDTDIEPEIPFQLSASSPTLAGQPGVSYSWLPPSGLNNPKISNPLATLLSSQTYNVTVTSAEGCVGSAQVTLNVVPPAWIYVPTAFTPDGDGKNEVLYLNTKAITNLSYFKIYNRWGQVVFFTNQPDIGWDGRYKGAEPVSGTYTYQLEGITDRGVKIKKEGNIMLIR